MQGAVGTPTPCFAFVVDPRQALADPSAHQTVVAARPVATLVVSIVPEDQAAGADQHQIFVQSIASDFGTLGP